MVSNSTGWSQRNNKDDAVKILRGNPTRSSPPPPNAAVVDMLVDDDNRPPQPSDPAPKLNRLQEWSAFQADFDEFLVGFAKFRKERGLPDARPPICSVDDDENRKENTWGTPEFRRVIDKLEQVNRDCSQLLDRLEQPAPRSDPSNANSNPQQPVRITQTPCVDAIDPLALQPPAPAATPDLQTPLLGEPPLVLSSSPATIHNVTHMVASDRPFAKLPPPAPDPVDMVMGTLWPQPRPTCKLIPVKRTIPTKPTIARRRDKDLRPP